MVREMEMAREMADVDTLTVDRCHSTLETWPSFCAASPATDTSLSGGIYPYIQTTTSDHRLPTTDSILRAPFWLTERSFVKETR